MIIEFIEEVFIKDDTIITRSTYNMIKSMGFTKFKSLHNL